MTCFQATERMSGVRWCGLSMGRRAQEATAGRSRRSPTTGSCPTARPPRWSRRAATSSGCACRGWTRPACSAPSSTATPAASASARRTSTVPAARRYLPGTMVLETSWGRRPAGSSCATSCSSGPGTTTTSCPTPTAGRPPTTTPTTCCCARCAASTARCRWCSTASRCSTTAAAPARWRYADDGYHEGVATADGVDLQLRLTTDMRSASRGRGPPPAPCSRRATPASAPCPGASTSRPAPSTRPTERLRVDRAPLAALAGPRATSPTIRWRSHLQRSALTLKGLTFAPTGALVAARDHVAARDAGRRAQLGLPLHLDPRLDVRPVGAVHARLRLGGQRLLLLHRRRGRARRRAADHVRRRRRARRSTRTTLDHLHGYDGARPVRDRQRRLQPAPARRVGRGARLGLPPHTSPATASTSGSGRSSSARSRRRSSTGASPTAASGRCAASRSTSRRPRSCAGSPPTAAPGWPGSATTGRAAERWQAAADEIHADICANGVDERGVFTQHYDTDALDASLLLMPLVRLPAPRRPAGAGHRAGHRRRAHRRRAGAALPGRGDRRRAGRRGGHLHDLLVLAGVGAVRDRRAAERARQLCEKLLSYASPLELYAEELDPHSGRHLGNFPQAFTHLALINAVMHVIGMERGHVQSPFS